MLNRHALSLSLEPVEESKERIGGIELVDERLLIYLKMLLEFCVDRFFSKSSLAEFIREVR